MFLLLRFQTVGFLWRKLQCLTTRLPIIIALCIISHLQKFLLLIIGSFSFSLYFTFMVNTMLSRSLSIILISYSFLLSFFILKVLWMEWYIFLNFGPTDFYFVLCFWRKTFISYKIQAIKKNRFRYTFVLRQLVVIIMSYDERYILLMSVMLLNSDTRMISEVHSWFLVSCSIPLSLRGKV